MMKLTERVLAVSLLLLSAPIAWAALEPLSPAERFQDEIGKHPCRAKAQKILGEWQATSNWTQAFSFEPSEKIFRSPTAKIGKWIQVRLLHKNEIELLQFTEKTSLSTRFNSNCVATTEILTAELRNRLNGKSDVGGFPVFRDVDLSGYIASKKNGVIFIWSPHMQISVEALSEIKKAAHDLKIELLTVVEPTSDPAAVEEVSKKLGLAKSQVRFLDSFDLALRGFKTHFPSLVVFSNGKISSPVRRGYEPAATYQEYVASYY